MLSFSNQVVLITGASRGIGAAAAIQFANAGAAAVVINYRNDLESAQRTAAEVERAGSRSLVLKADVSRVDEANALVDRTVEEFGRLDVLVANAGIWPAEDRPVSELGDLQWETTLRTNVDGVFFVCRRAARILSSTGRGNIVTVSSTAAQRGEAFHADYAASKGAVVSFTKSLAAELGAFNVRVNCVAPGWVDTEMSQSAVRPEAPAFRKVIEGIPLGRVASADDVAGPILFLASELARHVTGEVLNVNGGSVLCG
jgi:3-oxoacyl-[acyl-carrier protein] reductase